MTIATPTISPLAVLTDGMSARTRQLVIDAVQRSVTQGRYLDQCQEAAAEASARVEMLVHNHQPFAAPVAACPKCAAEYDEHCKLGVVRRVELLLMGRDS